ncbi:MAG: hypothetical protein LBD92_05060 [Oscillospiraceae bacterium]|jgi:hypothetical protein|nr:hypothetical protein [Oscillospiraceae bacterium]
MGNGVKRRWGDRSDGRRLRSLDAYYGFMPLIMKSRNDAFNFFSDSFEITEIDKYLREKRLAGSQGLGILHLFLAAYVRVVCRYPALNRFVSGQRIYSRENIEFVMSVKKEMSASAGETSIKVSFKPSDTLDDVYHKINAEIDKVRKQARSTRTDTAARALMRLPRLLLKFVIFTLGVLDYFGKIPRPLMDASPFHGSIIITDIGSIGLPPIYHHLYNFGNLPVFVSLGAKRKALELTPDGGVESRKYLDYTVVLDERICDGFYFSQAYRYLKSILRDPRQLEHPPEEVTPDID